MSKSLADYMRESDSDPYQLMGPPAPDPGWIYRDFRAMPRALWLQLLQMIGTGQVKIAGANKHQLPPAEFCRAQTWVSPAAQLAWRKSLAGPS